jgi:hypothetical protein
MILGMGSWVIKNMEFRIQDLGFGFKGSEFGVKGLGFRV